MLHGDGQYPPEQLDAMVAPLKDHVADTVFGSRMLKKRDALKGGMPLYKFIGNIVLTRLQNTMLGSSLSEFHSGYRAYRLAALKKIPWMHNSNGFDFDTDIIIQLLDNEFHIKEIPIPTRYGDEISHVNNIAYAAKVIYTTFLSRLQRRNMYCALKFNYAANPSDRL